MAGTKKTNNSFARDKIDLRVQHLPDGNVSVMDCFCGDGILWRGVKSLTEREIMVLPIDTKKTLTEFYLVGSNKDYLRIMDLTKYNVVDLDAYGVPFDQLCILFERQYAGVVFVTFIQTMYGRLPLGLLRAIGFTDTQIKKSPALFGKRGWDYFLQWLALNGVTEIHHRSNKRKHYLCFTMNKINDVASPASDCDTHPAGTAAGPA